MEFFKWLNEIDTQLLLLINSNFNNYLDVFFTLFTSKEIWIPLYLVLLIVIFRKYKMKGLWVMLAIILAIIFSDQISGIFKVTIQRFRPGHEPALEGLVHLPIGKRGSYGFLSSHAANSFALAIFIGLFAKSKRLWISLIAWAVLTSYSRVYVGVHYPFDVICGAILGALIGWGCYLLLKLFDNRFLRKKLFLEGPWNWKHSSFVIAALVIITVTLLLASRQIIRFQI